MKKIATKLFAKIKKGGLENQPLVYNL